jgi:flagellar basal body-associated protein FliL
MNSKLIIIAIVIVITLAFIAFGLISSTRITSVVPTSTGETTVTSEESSIVEDQIPVISEEQLNAVSVEEPTFLSDMQNKITADMSIFYYE